MVIRQSCIATNFSFQHELGHTQGARHDWLVDSTDNSPFTYNQGYYSDSSASGFRTVMAYREWVNGPGGNVIKTWYQASAAGGRCSITPSVPLNVYGTHTWWVQAWTDSGKRSDPASFTVATP